MAKERVAGMLALVLAALVGAATLAHVAQLVAIVVEGRVAATTLEVRDGVVLSGQTFGPGSVAVDSVTGGFVTDATILAVVALLVAIGSSLVRGKPFGRRTTTAVAATGIVIAVGGTVGAALSSFTSRHARSILTDDVAAPAPLELSLNIVTVSLLPLIAGLTIVVLAFVFRAGARLQRDTEGLV